MLMLPDFRVRQRDFLLEITRAITARLEIGEVLKRVLNASVIMLSGQVGLIALRAADGLFYVRAVSGIDRDIIPLINRHLHEIVTGAEYGLDREAFNKRLKELAFEINSDLQQFVALPLTFAGQPLGLMIVFRNYMSSASADDMQILQSFADQAAIAVHNAQLYEAIDQERNRLEAILDHSADGVMILDANLEILRFNRALERLTGWVAADVIGQHKDDVIRWERLEQGDLQAALDSGWPYALPADDSPDSLYVEGDLIRRDGQKLSVAITYAPMLTSDGQLDNIIANVRDITNFRKAQEMQSTFISVISHELKTPVAIIKGYAATLRRPDARWETQTVQDNLGVIEDEADRLDSLIQNLLTASKLQAQRGMELSIAEVRLDELVQRSVDRFETQTDQHQFFIAFPEDFPCVDGDEARLRQVLDNLISNAIKYSPKGGTIEVGGHYDDGYVSLYVRDEGVGMTKQEIAHIFDRFYRVDGSLSRKTQGTGLGLYLAKAIVEAHHGEIYVESQPGQGSIFHITLPLKQTDK